MPETWQDMRWSNTFVKQIFLKNMEKEKYSFKDNWDFLCAVITNCKNLSFMMY